MRTYARGNLEADLQSCKLTELVQFRCVLEVPQRRKSAVRQQNLKRYPQDYTELQRIHADGIVRRKPAVQCP